MGDGAREVEVLKEEPAEGDDGKRSVCGDRAELRDVFAGMGVCSEVGDGRVGQEDERDGGRIPRQSVQRP